MNMFDLIRNDSLFSVIDDLFFNQVKFFDECPVVMGGYELPQWEERKFTYLMKLPDGDVDFVTTENGVYVTVSGEEVNGEGCKTLFSTTFTVPYPANTIKKSVRAKRNRHNKNILVISKEEAQNPCCSNECSCDEKCKCKSDLTTKANLKFTNDPGWVLNASNSGKNDYYEHYIGKGNISIQKGNGYILIFHEKEDENGCEKTSYVLKYPDKCWQQTLRAVREESGKVFLRVKFDPKYPSPKDRKDVKIEDLTKNETY